MAKPSTDEYQKCTLRLEPETFIEAQKFVEGTYDFRSFSEFARAAIKHYLLVSKEQTTGGAKQSLPRGSTVTIRMALPLAVHRKVVWLAENKEYVTPIDLMFRYINDQVKDLDHQEMENRLKSDRRLAIAEAQKKQQEEIWLER